MVFQTRNPISTHAQGTTLSFTHGLPYSVRPGRWSGALPELKSKRNGERLACAEPTLAPGTPLRPELKDFIRRILVPILVDRYIKDSKKISPESNGVVQ